MDKSKPAYLTLAAFLLVTFFGGLNAFGVRYTVQELPPFWGATLRFFASTVLLFIMVATMRLPLPRGRALQGVVVYGALSVGVAYILIYWGLLEVPASLASVILSLVPLFTFAFAIAHRQERFRWRVLGGGLIALAGITVIFWDSLRVDVPLLSILAVVGTSACFAESAVVIKMFPESHPVTANALGIAVGTLILFGASLLWGEPRDLPAQPQTWLALLYLILFGTCLIFVLNLYVLKRWTASTTSYQYVLMPVVTIVVAALLAGEAVRVWFLLGSALVLVGVYVGALMSETKTGSPGVEPARD